MNNYSLLDVVVLAKDMPGTELKAGMRGTIVHIYSKPTLAYEVEFCDNKGKTIAALALQPEQLLPFNS
ncbi:MAG: DUF4926 domain-containing protein [Alphaproteobacteria bacterium]|nr:DUF4926 domain-containing protein [Alphaproteobacteria bacterium]